MNRRVTPSKRITSPTGVPHLLVNWALVSARASSYGAQTDFNHRYPRLENSRFFGSKSVYRSVRVSHLALCFQSRSRPFVWPFARIWTRKNTDCFAVYRYPALQGGSLIQTFQIAVRSWGKTWKILSSSSSLVSVIQHHLTSTPPTPDSIIVKLPQF